jgi:hypothetical protein
VDRSGAGGLREVAAVIVPIYDWYSDTDPKALDAFLAQQRKMSASEKIAAVFQLNRMLWHTAEAHERNLHPEADDREIFLRVAAHRLDRETMLRVYGWYPPNGR